MKKRLKHYLAPVLLSSIILSSKAYSQNFNLGREPNRTNDLTCPISCQLTQEYFIEPLYEDYLTKTAKESKLFKKQMEKKGGEKFVQECINIDLRVLYSVYNTSGDDQTMKDLVNIITEDYVKGDNKVDYYNPKVQANLELWVRDRFDFYNSLKNTNPKELSEQGFKEIVSQSYGNRENLEKRFGRHRKITEEFHDAMANTLKLGKGILKGIFGIMRKNMDKDYEKHEGYLPDNSRTSAEE